MTTAQEGLGTIMQELRGITPFVRVILHLDGERFEDVAALPGVGYEQAIVRATARAVGFPDRGWVFERTTEIGGESVDLFACSSGNPVLRGVRLSVLDPTGVRHEVEYHAELAWPNKSLLMAHAFAALIREYNAKLGVKARPFRPASRAV